MKRRQFYFRKALANNAGAVSPARVETFSIENLSSEVLESLEAGDVVIKVDSTGKHAYTVSFKGVGGLCLTYTDCENVETLAYTKTGNTWAFDDKTVTHIAQ